MTDMNEQLRRMRDRSSFQRFAPQDASGEREALADDATPKERAAHAAGVPLVYAERLRGDTDQELAADAVDFADALGTSIPRPPAPKPGSFGGGVRSVERPQTPTMDDRLRAARRALDGTPTDVDVFREMQIRESQDRR